MNADLILHHESSDWWSFQDINPPDVEACGGLSGPMAVVVSEETPRKLNFNNLITFDCIMLRLFLFIYIFVVKLCRTLAEGILGETLSKFSIWGLYITFVLAVGRFIRMQCSDLRMRIPYENLPTCDRYHHRH